ncbi:MAG: efflux RND transporter periplasmic adaptor subunit [Pyrinomonadaceae bacterium]|nr:efflux RND transporter periplasmic adaptor subunit [Pyrinomonadaceae bacterium]
MANKSRRRLIIIGSVVALLILAVVVIVLAGRRDAPEVVTVKAETRRELKSTVTASGEIRPIQYINITSEVQGRIEEIFVKEGEEVPKGKPLVRLDPTQLQSNQDAQRAAFESARDEVNVTRSQVLAAQNQLSQSQQSLIANDAAVSTANQQVSTARESLAQARQNIVAAQTDIDRAQVEVNAANRELKRNTDLVESGVVSRLEFDQARDRVETAKASLDNAKARLQTSKLAVNESNSRVSEAIARVKEAQARVNQQAISVRDARRGVDTANLSVVSSQSRANQQAATLRGQTNQSNKTLQVAPISGIVAEIPSKVGTFAVAGLSTTPLMTIADMSAINVEVKVDETSIDVVSVGQQVKIKVDAFQDREIDGEVTQKTPLAIGKSQTSGGLSTNINVQEAKEFRVVIQLKNLSPEVQSGLRPGMSATATITTKTANDVVSVPLQSIVDKQPDASPTPTPEGAIANTVVSPADKPKPIKGVFILENGKAKFVEITTGITGESDIQITSGVNAGMEIVTGPSRILKTLKDGDSIKKQTNKNGNSNK